MFKIKFASQSYYSDVIGTYYLEWNDGVRSYALDKNIADSLGLSLRKYRIILKKYNAFVSRMGECHFHKWEHAQASLEELETYIIMNKILE